MIIHICKYSYKKRRAQKIYLPYLETYEVVSSASQRFLFNDEMMLVHSVPCFSSRITKRLTNVTILIRTFIVLVNFINFKIIGTENILNVILLSKYGIQSL